MKENGNQVQRELLRQNVAIDVNSNRAGKVRQDGMEGLVDTSTMTEIPPPALGALDQHNYKNWESKI